MLFNQQTRILKNRDLLSIDYIPNKLVGRENEIKELVFQFSFLFSEYPSLPEFIIHGNTGTGKTATVKYVLSELESASKQKNIPLKIAYIKGSESKTKYEVLKNILLTIEPEAIFDKSASDIHSRIVEILASKGIFLLIFLDELHELKDIELNNTLFTISRLGEDLAYTKPNKYQIKEAKRSKVGYVLITNDPSFKTKLKDNTKSSLTLEHILFKRYNCEEIEEILKNRIDLGAVCPESIDEYILKKISLYSLKEGEDARYALRLLLNSAKEAEKKCSDKITEEIVDSIHETLEKNMLKESVRELPELYLEILTYIYMAHQEGKKINSKIIYPLYLENTLLPPVNYSRIVQIISDLHKNNILCLVGSKQLRNFSIEETAGEIKEVLIEKGRLKKCLNANVVAECQLA